MTGERTPLAGLTRFTWLTRRLYPKIFILFISGGGLARLSRFRPEQSGSRGQAGPACFLV